VADPLVSQLRALGVCEGASLLVHSSVRAVGPVERGAEGLLEALLAAVGDEGLLVLPAFTYWHSLEFDPATASGRTGVLGELLRARPGAVRSLHPTHSVVAYGPRAARLVERHHLETSLGEGSPFDTLARSGGEVLLLGVGHTANTTIHTGEALAPASYLDLPFREGQARNARVSTPSGWLDVELDTLPGCSAAFGAIERPLRLRRAVRDGRVGRAVCQLVPAAEIVSATVELLADDPAALLCTDPSCHRCATARGRLSR
jgi:aminoglycoside 3-N-acetyltransferase